LRVHAVFHLHGGTFDRFYGRLGPIRRSLARHILRRATVLIALSEYWRDFLRELAPNTRIEILANPIDPEAYALNSDWIFELGDKSALLLGSLGRRKGHYDAIKAFTNVLVAHPTARLVFAGREEDPGATSALRALAETAGLANAVVFAGPVTGEAKLRLMHRAAVHILPSYGENMPISVLEAMAIGKAVVATRVGAIPELIGVDHAGVLIEPGDWQALADGIIALLNSPSRATALGAAAKKRVAEHWHVERIVPQLSALYSDVIES
jgi:glycosyltransferase involved in cell wall biosynthesis